MTTVLPEFITKVFDSWTVLRLAERHGTGGRETKAKLQSLVNFVMQRLNKRVEAEDLADMLEDYLYDNLNVLCEDDSQYDVANLILQAFTLHSAGKILELAELASKLPEGCNLAQCPAQVVEADVDGEDEESVSAESSEDDVEMNDA
ncbi:unnamed protein product [Mesocestoides corti]|uniref:Pre-rRNA-processing protein TSR2 homolog n=1 Tax=Mesocestoides corti TaxID=53468 RepID=A0A0R3U8P1_MESCO|nr:unnamed protein product [Mesocestoides corti]